MNARSAAMDFSTEKFTISVFPITPATEKRRQKLRVNSITVSYVQCNNLGSNPGKNGPFTNQEYKML